MGWNCSCASKWVKRPRDAPGARALLMVRPRLLASRRARDALSNAEQIIEPGLHAAAHGTSLARAEEFGASVYDARFWSWLKCSARVW